MKKAAMIQQAKDKAKELGISWSNFIVGLIEREMKKQTEVEQQRGDNMTSIAILNTGQQTSINKFKPTLYRNKTEEKEQFQWIKEEEDEVITAFTQKVNKTKDMIRYRRDNEFRETRNKAKFKRLNRVIPDIDKIINTRYGVTTESSKDKSIPNDDIPQEEEGEE